MGEPEEKAQENFTDPDSRIMKTSTEGYQQCYNVQTAVDREDRIIVATGLTQSASDQRQLEPLLDAIEENLGEAPEAMLADGGHASERNLEMLEKRRIDGYIAVGREKTIGEGKPPSPDTALGRMTRKVRSRRGRKRYRARKHIAEPPFG